jgi:hypothetical protein
MRKIYPTYSGTIFFWSDGWWQTSIVNSHLAIEGFTRGCAAFEETGILHPDVGAFQVGQNNELASTSYPWSLESRVSTVGLFSYDVVGDCNTVRRGEERVGGWFYRPAQ